MKHLLTSLSVETLKTRKSRIFWITIIFFTFVASMMGLLMFVQKYPEVSGKMGMIADKAALTKIGDSNWQNYFMQLLQGIAGVGLIGVGFVVSWVFGREYSDRTIKDILALPISRTNIILSKFIVIVIWSLILALTYLLTGLLIGWLLDLSDWSSAILGQFLWRYSVTTVLTILLITPVSFFASYSKGIILPIGLAVLTLILANFTGMVGLGPYFPWAIPGIYAVTGGVQLISYIIIVTTFIVGYIATFLWWNKADQY